MNPHAHHRFAKPLLLGMALAIGSSAALAGPSGRDGPREHRFDADHLPPHLAALGLSESQKTQIRALKSARHAEREKNRAAAEALHEQMNNLSPAAPNYLQEVDRIATLMGQEHADRVRDRAAMKSQVWAILTPSQQAQLAASPKPRKMRWHGKK